MKILVCISNVPDTTTKIKFAEGSNNIDTAGIQWVINPWDELSLTRALELKDNASNGVTSVTVAHVGPPSSEPTIRKALAIGADDAVRVNADPSDAFYVAAQLAEVVKSGNYDIFNPRNRRRARACDRTCPLCGHCAERYCKRTSYCGHEGNYACQDQTGKGYRTR